MPASNVGPQTAPPIQALRKSIMPYARARTRAALWQLGSTLIPYLALWALMIAMLRNGLPVWTLIIPHMAAALLLVRLFIFFHDCCHGSFFKSRRANRLVGYLTGILTFTPFEAWRRAPEFTGLLERQSHGGSRPKSLP